MPTTPSESRKSLLSAGSEAVVRATAGVVAEHSERITACFYPRMFAEYPDLLRVFNQGQPGQLVSRAGRSRPRWWPTRCS